MLNNIGGNKKEEITIVGSTITIKDVDLLILDKINDNPFVIALDTGLKVMFSEESSNYSGSLIEAKTNAWLADKGIPTISRELDLTTWDGRQDYGTKLVQAAPLTFNEFRKYAHIIRPHISHDFWLATGWSTRSDYYGNFACYVYDNGGQDCTSCRAILHLAPAFILKSEQEQDLTNVSTEALIAELSRRFSQ